uniref:Putative secreted protein n=1 Tax=Anopheles marajoara TaxID=58244 RepID=A0A2M4CAQ8_9DIPT
MQLRTVCSLELVAICFGISIVPRYPTTAWYSSDSSDCPVLTPVPAPRATPWTASSGDSSPSCTERTIALTFEISQLLLALGLWMTL